MHTQQLLTIMLLCSFKASGTLSVKFVCISIVELVHSYILLILKILAHEVASLSG